MTKKLRYLLLGDNPLVLERGIMPALNGAIRTDGLGLVVFDPT